MFKSSRWRNEKNKIKIVFKLQFHATQVPELKSEGLTVSIVPRDVGKATKKAEKATVLDGQCRWETPVYETVKFSGKANPRIYHLIVSTTGSTKAGVVGETKIDFGDYVDAIKTCNVTLPLQSSNLNLNSKAILLHVSIQRQLENVDLQRVANENDSLRSGGSDLKSHSSIEGDEIQRSNSQEENPFGKVTRITELRRRASIESISTLSSFDSVSELDSLGEMGNRTMHQHSVANVYEEPHVSESEWSGSSDQGISTDDSMNSSNDNTIIPRDITTRTSLDDEVEKLKAELVALARRADLSELELQSLRKQIVKETKRSQDLLREVTSLKEERDTLKGECESFIATDKRKEETKVRNKLQFDGKDPQFLLEELDYEKDMNSNLRLQLEKTQESNTELILAVHDLEAMLGQRRKRALDLPRPRPCETRIEESRRRSCTSETDDDDDQKALDELVKGHMDAKDAHALERRITDLYNEIEIYKRDKEDLEIQVEQIALDYEILKQENHDISYKLEQSQVQEQLKMQYECSSSLVNVNELESQIESLEAKLKKQSEDFSESLCRIQELETHIEGMEGELEKQAQIFEVDIEDLTRDKVKQEQRAIEAEEALRKTRCKNASVAGKIQDEFKRISQQMSFTFAANEKMTKKAMTETHELRMQKRQLEELLMNANDELKAKKVEYEAKLNELSENQKRQQEHVNADLTQEISRLKDEIEEQIKLKENALEASSEMFIEKEMGLSNRIEELETRLNKLSQNNQETDETIALELKGVTPSNKRDDDVRDLVKELVSLREQNGLMEMELKEMQERYSEISLRFAEVEGERQQLVMTVRNLKNAKRS